MARQSWTDDRLDDRFDHLEAEMDQRFKRVEAEMKAAFRSELAKSTRRAGDQSSAKREAGNF